jgi:hypothetical protein
MVWTSPKRSDALRSSANVRQASFNDKNGKSNLTTPNSDSNETIRSPKPLHDTYAAAQRLQRNTRSNYGSRPSTAMSFTTYSSDMIQGQDPEFRPYSPTLPSHISQTPTPCMGTLLPSPPEEITICHSYSPERSRHTFSMPSHTPSQEIYDQQDSQLPYIPSAQPYTPLAYSPPSMSSSSLLPSPPMTQSSDERFRSSHGPPMSPAISTSSHRHPELPCRRRPTYNAGATTSLDSKKDGLSESEMFDSVLEGIGRIHVSMGRDDAGRWRIKRAAGERP